MSEFRLTKEKFLEDVCNHQLTVIKDDGLYRHIRLKDPTTICQYFDIVTYPGYLVYSGDMGCYLFKRTQDMFEFFRGGFNPRYWAEKLQAEDVYGRHKKFSWSAFKENLYSMCSDDLQKDFLNEELRFCEEDEIGAMNFIREFDNDNEFMLDLSDFFEHDNDEYSHRYVWCCYALPWAIAKYDEAKQGAA